MRKNLLPGYLSGITAAAIWGGMYVVSKVILEVIPPFSLLSLRLILGAVVLLTIAAFSGVKTDKKQLMTFALVGFVGYGVSLSFQFIGTKLSTASNGSLVTSATPALVLPFAYCLLREKLTPLKIAATLIATIGVLVIIDPRNIDLSSDLFWGNISLVLAAITWAAYSVLVSKYGSGNKLIFSTAIFLLAGLTVSLPVGIYEYLTVGWGVITSQVIWGVLFLGIVSTAAAMFLWNYAFTKLSASQASLTFFAQPLVGTLLGWYLLYEKITLLTLGGGALILVGIYLSTRE